MKHNTEYHNISDLTENERDILLEMLWNKSTSQGQSQLFNFDIKIAKTSIMNNDGFTLIELLVVVAIIGILAAVGVVAYNGYTASAKANNTMSNYQSWRIL